MREEIDMAALTPPLLTVENGEQSFCFAPSFIGFAGHFPDYPILPAVLQTLMVQMLAEQVVGDSLQFLSLERAKFTRQLRPEEQIDVTVQCKEKEGEVRCSAKLAVADESAASFTLLLGRGDPR